MISQKLSPLILASASPRRKALLEGLGYDFQVRPSQIDESIRDNETPEENAERLACLKARSGLTRIEKGTVIGCDTVVAVGSEVLGKPDGPDDAVKRYCLLHLGNVECCAQLKKQQIKRSN